MTFGRALAREGLFGIRRRCWREWRVLQFDYFGRPYYHEYEDATPVLTLDDYKATDWEVI